MKPVSSCFECKHNMEYLDIAPIKHISGNVILPGSKSLSNRVLLLSALAQGTTEIQRLLDSDDVTYMLQALTQLGVNCYRKEGTENLFVDGVNSIFPIKHGKFFVGNAGIVYRLLTAVLAFSKGKYELLGAPRMHERPISDLVDALRKIGADIHCINVEGYPPLVISQGEIHVDSEVCVKGNTSSQFLTAMLMALPMLNQDTTIRVIGDLISKPYVIMTIQVMEKFGVHVEHDESYSWFKLIGGQQYTSPGLIDLEGDASSASYFLAAGAINGGPVRVEGVGRHSIQGDIGFVNILELMGATVKVSEEWIEISSSKKLRAYDGDLNHMPDAAMTLAIVALFADGTTSLRNIGSWRVKETDRLSAMATELRKVGAVVEEGSDYIRITPPVTLIPNATIETYQDHRMAMCFSLVALGGVPIRIIDPKCVTKTFPEYFKLLFSISK